jgi:hypothetical protein
LAQSIVNAPRYAASHIIDADYKLDLVWRCFPNELALLVSDREDNPENVVRIINIVSAREVRDMI